MPTVVSKSVDFIGAIGTCDCCGSVFELTYTDAGRNNNGNPIVRGGYEELEENPTFPVRMWFSDCIVCGNTVKYSHRRNVNGGD